MQKFKFKIGLKWKFVLGFLICTGIASLSGLAGILSLERIQNNMKKTTMEINDNLNEQLATTQQVIPLRAFAISIINAESREELDEIQSKLQGLQRTAALRSGEENAIQASIELLLSQKNKQHITLSNLEELSQTNADALTEVMTLAVNFVDNTEFESAIQMDEAMTDIRESIGKMARSSSVDDKITKISDTAGRTISTIKSAMSVKSFCNELNAMVKKTLSLTESASVDYAKIEIMTLIGNIKNELTLLPKNDATEKISMLLGNLTEQVDQMVAAKNQVLLAENELKATSAAIWKQLGNVEASMLVAARNMKTNADRVLETSTRLVHQWQSIELILVIGSLILAFIISVYIAGFITRSINKVADIADFIAGGDLSQRLDMKQKDEIGHMAMALDNSCKNLSDMIAQIKGNAETLTTSSEEMSAVSAQLAAGAEEMSTQSSSVAGTTEQMSTSINSMASAAEEMSVNIQSVSSTAEEMSQNMNAVAAAIEEMSMSIQAVAARTQEGSDIALQAAEVSTSTTETMTALSSAAKEIGDVTSLIKRIAEQTNLLALNATIEAASAGDAGKGFAVVANEIKELANQSAQAAENIARRIEGVQLNTEEATNAIAAVEEIINKINASSMEITKSVQQQTVTASEISGNVQQAKTGVNNIAASMTEIARGANDVSQSAAETAKGVNEVSGNVQAVSKSVSDSTSGIQQVNASAGQLAEMAAQIQQLVGRFKIQAV